MKQNVMVTGAGKEAGLGFNLAKRYLDTGNRVIATVRKRSEALERLKEEFKDDLIILYMDIASSDSVRKAAEELRTKISHIDLLINNAVHVSPDCDKGFFEADLDYIPDTVNVTAVGAMRVIKEFFPLLQNSPITALIMNISSEAGSITRCYRTNIIEYAMAKAALNMATMNIFNTVKKDRKVNIFAVHPGWIRTDGRDDNPAPLSSYEAAVILQDLFEKKREDFEGHRFITNENEDYPF